MTAARERFPKPGERLMERLRELGASHDILVAAESHVGWLVRTLAPPKRTYVPTPDELDLLLSDISAAGYASEAREIVENWTRNRWGVESAFTTRMDPPAVAEDVS